MKNFNETWISPGATVVEKDSLKKHINSELNKQTVELGNKRNLRAASYTQEIIEKMPIGHGLKKMCTDDRKALKYKFNTVKPVLTTTFLKRPPVLNDHAVVLPYVFRSNFSL